MKNDHPKNTTYSVTYKRCECVCVCVHACVWVRAHACVCVRLRACVRVYKLNLVTSQQMRRFLHFNREHHCRHLTVVRKNGPRRLPARPLHTPERVSLECDEDAITAHRQRLITRIESRPTFHKNALIPSTSCAICAKATCKQTLARRREKTDIKTTGYTLGRRFAAGNYRRRTQIRGKTEKFVG